MRATHTRVPAASARTRLLVTGSAAALALVLTSSAAAAQRGGTPTRVGPSLHVTPYAGFLMSGDVAGGPLGTNLTSANGPVVGAQVGIDVTPNIAIVGNLGYSSTDLRVGAPIIGGFDVGESTMWIYDGGVQLGIPIQTASGMGLRPFVQGGVGAITQRLNNQLLDSQGTNLAYNLGGGLDVRFTPSIGLQLMARDYIGRFDTQESVGFDLGGDVTHRWALTAGLRIGF